jgi:cell division protein ZapA
MPDNNRIIKVHIFGEEYALRGGEYVDEAEAVRFRQHLMEVASFLDQKMHEMADRTSNRSPKNVAILAALNVSEELLRLKREREDQISSISSAADELVERLDQKLLSASSG